MKKPLLLSLLLLVTACGYAQQVSTPGPAEKKLIDSLCNCISKIDMSKIHNKQEASTAFTDCFAAQSSLLIDVASEKGIKMDDDAGMDKLGNEIGQHLMKENCAAAMKLGVRMAGDDSDDEAKAVTTEGVFKRIENKGFNYVIIADKTGEKSFLWLRQFPESEKFMNGGAALAGKKLKIEWREIEVYLPNAKGYYKQKEITGISVL